MKKLKKLQSGMTLVEVIVAMAVFGAMTLAITMGLAAAVQYNVRNLRRDAELSAQQTSIEDGSATGTAVLDAGASFTFNQVGGTETFTVSGTEYEALKTATNAEDYNFTVKTFSSSASIDSGKTVVNPATGSYRLTFINESECELDVKIQINTEYDTFGNASIFEGDMKAFVLSSDLYERTIPAAGIDEDVYYTTDTTQAAPTGFEVGFKYGDEGSDLYTLGSVPILTVYIYNGSTCICAQDIAATGLYSYGQLNFVVVQDGATCKVGSYTGTNIW